MEKFLKKYARRAITVMGISLLVTVLAAVLDLYDVRVILAVILAIRLGQPVYDLTNKIKALQDSDPPLPSDKI